MNREKEAKKFIKEFEGMMEIAEMKALSKISLERPLNEREHRRYMELGRRWILK